MLTSDLNSSIGVSLIGLWEYRKQYEYAAEYRVLDEARLSTSLWVICWCSQRVWK